MFVTRAVFVTLCACASAVGQEGRYADPQHRFSFDHPTAWTVSESPAGVVVSAPDGTASFAVSPFELQDDVAFADVADGYEQMLRRARPGLSMDVLEDAACVVAGRTAHRRVFRIGDGDGAVRLEAHVLAGSGCVLTTTATCALARHGAYAKDFASMLESVAPGAKSPAADTTEIAEKLRALDAARGAGILTEEEYAKKRAELEASLHASRPDPDVEKKLNALDAARQAGVLDEAEYQRKRAELVAQPKGPAGGTGTTPEAPAGKKGATYRHPIGFSFWRPAGWKVEEQEDFLQISPPDPAMEDGGPLELYFVIGDTVEGTGISRPDDPQVVAYLDEQVKSIVPMLERKGRPASVDTARGKGAVVDWACKTPDGRDLLARCYVTIVQQHGVALLALGLPDKIAPRESDLRAMFSSFGFGEAAKDPALVGSWELVSTTSIRNDSPFETDWSRASAVGERRSRINLAADGTYERVDDWHMIALGSGVSLEDKQRDVDSGSWCAGDGGLYLISKDQTWRDYRYRLERTQSGVRLRLAAGERGEIFEPAR